MARKSLWQPEFAEQAKNLCLLGATDTDIARFFNVGLTTISNWKKKQPDFASALKAGKMSADSQVAKSLYRRAIGFTQQEVDIRVVKGELVQTVITKKYAPDTVAQIFWLKNRQPELWSDRREPERTLDDELKQIKIEFEKFKLARAIAATTETEKDDDQTEFLKVLAQRLNN